MKWLRRGLGGVLCGMLGMVFFSENLVYVVIGENKA